ncbi:rRNA maturation RNase YbeY [Ferruginibacter albus]|uniref:rRNA maturation RNase YbeY n=1 Tax=Ferruginibacter albus TaxID=2875540 RepID=UPI001CC41C98|nr:rRNA maturation RNase YbeY [Ferruginibacter albus]UAY52069.1 rRNA maturation RNase YbeY [Ferruginibacter albus]
MKIKFFFPQKTNLKDRNKLKLFVEQLFRKENHKLESLVYIFTSDKEVLEMNKNFLNHNYYTDILTFDLSSSNSISGEVYISIDRVKENAQNHNTSFIEELHRVIFHGALHLCGYKDKSKAEIAAMRKRENQYLKSYFKRFHMKH